MDYSFLNTLDLSSDSIRKLTLNLDSIVEGRNEILRSPTGGDLSSEVILERWDKIFKEHESKLVLPLVEMESSNRSKFGPRSIALPWSERIEDVMKSFKPDNVVEKLRPHSVASINSNRLRPLTLKVAADYLKPSTSSGLPFLVKKRNAVDSVLLDFENLLKRKDPCVLFTRTQESGKTRTVWGFPIADTLNEMRFYRPILEYQKKLDWRSALTTPENVDLQVTRLIDQAIIADNFIISMDMRGYDSTVRAMLQEAAFLYFIQLFQPKYKDELLYILHRFGNIGLITPNGILNSPHGVPSGSTFTNEVDSVVQYLIAYTGFLTAFRFQIQGDDSLYQSKDPDSVFDLFARYGLEVSGKDKTFVSKDYCVYLQFLYHKQYRNKNGIIGGVYSTYRALNRIIHPERFDDFSESEISGKDYFAIKNLSILENCKNSPLFVDLVKFVMSLDKYSLNVSDLGLRQYVALKSKQEGKDIKFNSWSYGDEIRGIKNFESYKLVKELSV